MLSPFFAPSAQRGSFWLALSAPVAGIAALFMLAGTAQARCADLALVLAIDASGSINADEFALQKQGYVHAFRSPRVQSALAAAGKVDVGIILWGDSEMALQVLPLARLQSAGDAEALSRRIEALPRRVFGNTGIGRAVSKAIDLLDAPDECASRRIINLSGDGLETIAPRPRQHVPLALARNRAEASGITINALAIETDVPDLGNWFRDRLITGPGAFVLAVDSFETFGLAIEKKLAREIRPEALSLLRADNRVAPHPD